MFPEFTLHIEKPFDTNSGFRTETDLNTMLALKDIIELLDRWPKWKRIQSTPEQIEALVNRVAALEERLTRCPGEGCPKCGELTYRVESSKPHHMFGNVGAMMRTMKCEKCGFTEPVTIGNPARNKRV
ncbi:MAG TPA: hypothetical protein VGK21_17635 [Candidatus Angelobacter sp.]|jgi:predicted RNA-binding Zn-ribbon protein involved in translation (DUF1610 family)